MQNRLTRSTTDVILGGVCAGLGKYLRIDTTLVRLFFIVFTLAGGIGVLLYLILWVVVPPEGHVEPNAQPEVLDGEELKERAGMMRDEFVDVVRKPRGDVLRYIGIGLVVYGGYLLLKAMHFPWLSWLSDGVIWAALILLAGVVLLLRAFRSN